MTRRLMNDILISQEDFREQDLMRRYSWIEPYQHGSHDSGSKSHETFHYKFLIGDGIYAHWSVCQECKQLRTKKLIGYIEKDEDGYSTTIVHDIIKNGERM